MAQTLRHLVEEILPDGGTSQVPARVAPARVLQTLDVTGLALGDPSVELFDWVRSRYPGLGTDLPENSAACSLLAGALGALLRLPARDPSHGSLDEILDHLVPMIRSVALDEGPRDVEH